MRAVRVSMRWWLALVFALIAALTAVAVAQLFVHRAEHAFRERVEQLAAGNAVGAASGVTRALRRGDLNRAVQLIAERRRLALFVFDHQGNLITAERSRRTSFAAIPQREDALEAALAGRQFVAPFDRGQAVLVALPLETRRAGALIAYASRPELAAELGIVREEIIEAALLSVAVGAVAGLLVATLIARRLRRIGRAAAAIESGDFDTRVPTGFRDELGALAATIDRMRQRLRESFAAVESERDRLEQLLERLHDGVVTVEPDLTVEFANSAARQLLGEGLEPGHLLPEPFEHQSLRELARGLFSHDADVAQAQVSPEEDVTYAIVGIPARRAPETAVLVFTDISQRERRERAEREFVANAAHELRTPLAAITSAVEVLQSGAKEIPEERDRFLAHVQREAERLGRLARALLVLARAETQEEEPRLATVELEPLFQEVAAGLTPRAGVSLEVRCPPGLAVLTQRDLLEQVVANLAANAAKHTERGRVELTAEPAPRGSVVIAVRDTGPGIPTHVRERIFDRFYRGRDRDGEGFGLGLAIVRQAVRALGGTVEVESQPGHGTTVRVTVPGAEAQAA
jgi:signal transduction histidine kinase/HAMP domain-containing protein